ncbi:MULTISPECIES: tRNA (adenosine(37)-N6)-threonylcarbamoyltransferase complex ATPase subunit type 1 TsaE [unclassified Enterococcus]|uniref:tRNA (adenosine(37)-N6)-threonylcarbamoyltransferase complex ATPase subunit type 1 TsaE n=1 Tax=unclassified Enterococcus TaxID=2608891 RepID=UPI001555C8C0|nr:MULTISPECIES: tRNA (adenosine(37)-N6)-threonylcarbamoyltransferase complex ATPase subunit type 1 TsaE [unclassified Enterococcus]MBS7576800.1 tRNA (adenosine(37)-N6)-threonylcarbamoyltransferase complex ATPase subunit type 1 TsaE [Enterococcus sp. MMGLQ5-2]MBS7584207.1 tRNA (adenosine(37)-N6)-threonylcarbamoyltransferase complex ATPase subunit type 1 TsaE [Enterococcus sp. MMGLQ5-1]NPD12063.1 tRNA (adenosine(37)-N6)-threonylcarbamoyltransferase complex ATPase subunit type 1 TsaE [Enterococcus
MYLNSEVETALLGQRLGEQLFAGSTVILTGDLGAGKTSLSKGIAKGLGVNEMVKSPTYTIVREYHSGRLPFYHMDIYRTANQVQDLELDDYFYGDGVTVVEWGELLGNYLPESFLKITLLQSSAGRNVNFEAHGLRYQPIIDDVEEYFLNE